MADNLDLDTDISDYFRSNLLALREAINAQEFRAFGALNTGAERVAFVLKYPEAHCLPLEVEHAELKDSTKAIKLKEEGNKYFGGGDFVKALDKYSNAILVASQEDSLIATSVQKK
ncbi:uncharacterized protein LOC117179673 [Belonocnema kinseyi]|uniref:uncharacterized protein LOC117179673 n=1 Tax=Belonocnema kinseyi TaxID=2817044 RepID=UPI00143CE3A6|nr:uncharacterized protein LOC117179673 [Belonocnema kinseyi]XP_033227586.1 uncharacterized protein LOC117179673 [Belonocnema kinseyi]